MTSGKMVEFWPRGQTAWVGNPSLPLGISVRASDNISSPSFVLMQNANVMSVTPHSCQEERD